jgi:hypothetical protein
VVFLSQKALALAKSASDPAPRAKSVDDDGEVEQRPVQPDSGDADGADEPPRRRIDTRA